MVIELCESIRLEELDSNCICALELIGHSRRQGINVILGNANHLRSISKLSNLSETVRAIFKKLAAHQTQKGQLWTLLSTRVRITGGKAVSVDFEGSVKIINIPLSHFAKIAAVDAPILLGENMQDARFSAKIAKIVGALDGLGKVTLNCRFEGGGGSTTVDSFVEYRDQGRLCMCVLDSDKLHPDGPLGNTAKNVLSAVDSNMPWAGVKILDVRDIENLIPSSLIEIACRDSTEILKRVAQLQTLESGSIADLRYHSDFKNGTLLEWVFGQSSKDLQLYWLTKVSSCPKFQQQPFQMCLADNQCKYERCKCELIPSFGDSLLGKCSAAMDEMSPHKAGELLCKLTKDHWLHLGRDVLSWTLGSNPVYA